MAVQAQFGGHLLPPYAAAEEQQIWALKDYGALLSAAADDGYACGQAQYDYCAAQSELTCNGGDGRARSAMPVPSLKRGRDEDDLWHYYAPAPLPAMQPQSVTPASTSGRLAQVPTAAERALASELWRLHGAEVDVLLLRAECDRLCATLDVAHKRQRQALVRAAVGGLHQRARHAETQLEVARRRAAELEERVRLAAAEAQAWCGVARANEAVAEGLRATLDALLLRSSANAEEAFGESEPDDAQSCCCEQPLPDTAATGSSPPAKWACRACGADKASVLVLPCRHLCLCKACESRTDACPVCSGAKNASLHIAPN